MTSTALIGVLIWPTKRRPGAVSPLNMKSLTPLTRNESPPGLTVLYDESRANPGRLGDRSVNP